MFNSIVWSSVHVVILVVFPAVHFTQVLGNPLHSTTMKILGKKVSDIYFQFIVLKIISCYFVLLLIIVSNDYHYRSPTAHSKVMQFSIKCSGPKLWNPLPQELIQAPTLGLFKEQMKHYLLFSQF